MVKFEVLGKKWVGDILRALESGPKGFNEIMKTVSPEERIISSRTLSNRLEDLQTEGIVSREVTSTKPPRSVYTLTEKGKEALLLQQKIVKL